MAIARFRTSSHNLAIETGRHHKPNPIPVSERLCSTCNVVEDEIHHLISCKIFVDTRKNLFQFCSENCPDFHTMSENAKFNYIISSKCEILLSKVGEFLLKANSFKSTNL